MNKVEEILTRAGEILAEPEHWYQGALSNFLGGYCSIGAIRVADCNLHGVPTRDHLIAITTLSAVVAENFGASHIPTWNDDPSRTHPEVVAMFEKARALAAERGL